MRFSCPFSHWCHQYRDRFLVPSSQFGCCCGHSGSVPADAREEFASNTYGERKQELASVSRRKVA